MSKAKSKSDNKTEKALAAEKEQFNKQQVNHKLSLRGDVELCELLPRWLIGSISMCRSEPLRVVSD